MGNSNNYKYATFEDINKSNKVLLVNTLTLNEQECLIKNTIVASQEENEINDLLSNKIKADIIVYGKNFLDRTVYKKYEQLNNLGFNVRIYIPGLFEWLLLQDIYGFENFPTTSRELDILRFRPQHPVSQSALSRHSVI
jgi:hypothetical protein